MLKGRYIGLANNACNKFCYLVLTIPEKDNERSQVLTQSVVRPHYRAERAPIVFTRIDSEVLEFYKNDRKTPLDENKPIMFSL